MAATMLSGVLAACSNESTSENKPSDSNEFYSAPFENGKYVEPVTISTVFPITSSLKFKNGENIENNVHTKWAHDTLGIDIKYLWTVSEQNNAYQTKLRLMLTSGQKMPDIISFRGDSTLISDLIESGQFTDAGIYLINMPPMFTKKRWRKIQTYGIRMSVMVNEWLFPFWRTLTIMIPSCTFAKIGSRS